MANQAMWASQTAVSIAWKIGRGHQKFAPFPVGQSYRKAAVNKNPRKR
jgi:hypothetical protein